MLEGQGQVCLDLSLCIMCCGCVVLFADMAGFKAANPGAVFEDFVRWNSPRDWIKDDEVTETESVAAHSNNMKGEWPPKGKLSARMAEPGNTWVRIWESVRGVPISQQRPLFDYTREAEKVGRTESPHPCRQGG